MIEQFIDYLKFTDGIASSDVLGWMFATVGAFVMYKLIDNMQMSIERHNMLREVEATFTNLYNSVIALSYTKEGCTAKPKKELEELIENKEIQSVMVRSVLHEDSDWETRNDKESGKMQNPIKMVNSQRFVLIRDNVCEDKKIYYYEWISTQALHEIILQCRRIEKMFKSGIVKRIDLSDMSKELVVLGICGRVEFFASYYSKYDAECIGYLVMQTVVSCNKYKNYDMLKRFIRYYKQHEDIQEYFVKNVRMRRIKDLYAILMFKKICKKNEKEYEK